MWPFMPSFIHLEIIHVVVYVWIFYSFLWLNIPLYRYIPFYLSVHQMMNICIIFTFRLLWTILLWAFEYKFLCENVFSFLGYIPRNGTAGSVCNSIFNFSRKTKLLPTMTTPFYISTSNTWVFPVSAHPPQYLLLSALQPF